MPCEFGIKTGLYFHKKHLRGSGDVFLWNSAEGCRIQTTATASRRALLTGRVSSQAERAQAKQHTDSKPIQPISLNRATQAELESLPGIGEKKAQAILAYRDAHGRFRSYKELLEVEGIGEATLEGLLPYLTLE